MINQLSFLNNIWIKHNNGNLKPIFKNKNLANFFLKNSINLFNQNCKL